MVGVACETGVGWFILKTYRPIMCFDANKFRRHVNFSRVIDVSDFF